MSRKVHFNRWRISLKTIKWWTVLCIFIYPLSTLLQYYVLQLPHPKDVLGYAILIVTFLGPIIAGIFYLLEETVDPIDGRLLQKRENITCAIIAIISLIIIIILNAAKISLFQ